MFTVSDCLLCESMIVIYLDLENPVMAYFVDAAIREEFVNILVRPGDVPI